MNFKDIISSSAVMLFAAAGLASCSNEERVEQAQNIVINELMASNRTGILTHKGKAADWIELKNMSTDSINLKDFRLQVEMPADTRGTKENQDVDATEGEELEDGDENLLEWIFPDVSIPAGETLLVFVKKKKNKDTADDESESKGKKKEKKDKPKKRPGIDKPVVADLRLPKEGGIVRFLTPSGTVLREVKYPALAADQAFALQTDSTYTITYLQSPGFENNRDGYEAAMQQMHDQRQSPLLIWELMSRAEHSYQNWVELKNVSTEDIDLSEYALSKKRSKKKEAWTLPKRILKPGEIITITLAGSDRSNGPLQAPFKLGDAETIVLSKDGKFVDGVNAKQTPRGGSIGRIEGKKGFFYFSTPTRNAENGSDGRRFIAEDVSLNMQPGVYESADEIILRLNDPAQTVHYTLNGSLPTEASPIFKDSIVISKNTTVRMFAEGDSLNLRSKTATATYILGAKHQMPVVNITVNNSDLYDFNTGIYAQGPGYGEEWPHPQANFWKPWIKNAHVELFDNKEDLPGFSVDCGLRIFGGFSRNEDKKSFRLKFRGQYGISEVEYDFFGDGELMALKDLVLRSGSQDWTRCMLRDEFFTSLMQEHSPTLLTQKYRPIALYVNGEYFGLYYLREKIDKNFVARKLGTSNDNIDILMSKGYVEEGSKADYTALINYVKANDMTQKSHYDYVKNRVDLQGLIDFKLGEIYAGNSDVGNVRMVRSTDKESDGKWHFVYYDLDATWVGYKPSTAYYLSTTGGAAESNVAEHNVLINRLLTNPDFRALFLQRLSHHLSTTFSPSNAEKVFDGIVAQIRPEMERNCERWPQLTYAGWEKNITSFKEKFTEKPKVILNDIRDYLKITPEENKKYFSKLGY